MRDNFAVEHPDAEGSSTEIEYDGDEHDTDTDMKRMTPDMCDHVTMEVTVDVSDMDEQSTEVMMHLANMYEEAFTEVVNKNRDYGFSFLKTGTKMAETDGVPVDSPARMQALGLLTRTGDKRERVIENVYGNGSSTVSDDPSTTAIEAANYWFFIAFVLANPELAGMFGPVTRSDSDSTRTDSNS